MMKKIWLAALLLSLLFGASCKKDNTDPTPDDDGRDPAKEILLRDSTYFYSLAFSLWEDKLPAPKDDGTGNPDLKAFTNQYKDAEEVLSALRQIIYQKSGIDDRFSFIDRAGTVSEEIQQGVYKETGVTPIYLSGVNGESTGNMYIKLVQKKSPAEAAGLKRGMRVLSMNGDSKLDYDTDQAQGFKNFYKFMSGETLKLVVQSPGEQNTKEITVTGAAYNIDPILSAQVIAVGDKKVGYLAYTSFVNVLSSNGPNSYYNALTKVFNDFEAANIDELVVDLRYNGGGSTNSAELLANLIAPKSADKGKMYDYKFNRYYEEENISINFDKKNSLNLGRVYFLGTQSTASASELVMNVLAPYMTTEIITTSNMGTYGKPVGFFGWPVVNRYADLYITSFKMTNSAGYGDYFSGLKGNKSDAADGFFSQLGDPNELMLKEALYHIAHGNYEPKAKASSRNSEQNLLKINQVPEIKEYRNNMYIFPDKRIPNLPLKN